MILTIFHLESHRLFHGTRGEKSPFRHKFGAAADYAGLTKYQRQPPVHLLFRLNTADPAVGVTLAGVQWLPLLCAIRYLACDLGYRVLSDSRVKILHQTEKKAQTVYPYEDYPEKLPPKSLAFREGSYNPRTIKDGLNYAGVFGYEALSAKQYSRLLRRVEKERLPEMLGWESAEAYLEQGNSSPFVQGRPIEDCPDQSCINHGKESSLRTLAIFEEEGKQEIRKLWGPAGENAQIIWQICPICAAIRATNQCT